MTSKITFIVTSTLLFLMLIGSIFKDARAFFSQQHFSVNENRVDSLPVSALKIGDSIPEEIWSMSLRMINIKNKKDTVLRLEKFKDKPVVILDFWNIWCGSCITAIDHGAELMREFRDEVALFPVTKQSTREIQEFAKKNKIIAGTELSLIVEAEKLAAFFPFISVPHVVLIRDGKVFHIGSLESVEKKALAATLSGQRSHFKYFKNDFFAQIPLLKMVNTADLKTYRLLGGYRNDAPAVAGVIEDTATSHNRYYFYNHSLLNFYQYIFDVGYVKLNQIDLSDTGIGIEEFAYHIAMGVNKIDWLHTNAYSYEVMLPKGVSESHIKSVLYKDLENSLGIQVEFSPKNVKVLKINYKNVPQELYLNEGEATAVYYLIDHYNRLPNTTPIIAEENLTRKLYFPKLKDYSSMSADACLAFFEKHGIGFYTTEEIIPIMIVSKSKMNKLR